MIIDDITDLLLNYREEFENLYLKIINQANRAGVYLVLSAQLPSAAVIPTSIVRASAMRISFSVTSQRDSMIILEEKGADYLAGNGEFIYRNLKQNEIERLQGLFVSDSEISKISDYARKLGKPAYLDQFILIGADYSTGSILINDAVTDPLYDEIVSRVKKNENVTTSFLMREYGTGYHRAAGLMDALRENGIIENCRTVSSGDTVTAVSTEQTTEDLKVPEMKSQETAQTEVPPQQEPDLDYSMTLKLVGVEETVSDNQTEESRKPIRKDIADKSGKGTENKQASVKIGDWMAMITFILFGFVFLCVLTDSIWHLVIVLFSIFGFMLSAPFLRGRVMDVIKNDNLRYALVVLCYFIIIVSYLNRIP